MAHRGCVDRGGNYLAPLPIFPGEAPAYFPQSTHCCMTASLWEERKLALYFELVPLIEAFITSIGIDFPITELCLNLSY